MQQDIFYSTIINQSSAKYFITATCIYALTIFSGCTSPQSRIDASSLAPYAVNYYKRAWMEFDRAIFYKPSADNDDGGQHFAMAPLLIEEILSSDKNIIPDGFGTVVTDTDGKFSVDPSQPTIYTTEVVTPINGESYDQLIYVWWYHPTSAQSRTDLLMRGIRITLGKDGFPLVGEVLDDDKVDIIFVTETLENAAKKAFGPALFGRQFSAERGVADAPLTVVARLLDDGPIPMGPYVYLLAGSRNVTTLSCRCAASQIDRFVETKYYHMLPLEALGLWGFQNVKLHTAFGNQFALDQRLRWFVE